MSNRLNQHIDSPAFKELAFRVLSRITPAQKETLTPNESVHFANEAALRKFCTTNRIDTLLYTMAKVGIDWTFRIHEDAVDADMLEANAPQQYEFPAKRADMLEAAERKNVCIISSREVMVNSHLVAQNSINYIYNISDYSQRVMATMKAMKTLTEWDREVVKAHEGHDTFNRLILEQSNSFEWAEENLGLEYEDIRILLALYLRRNTASTMSDIAEVTKATGRKMYSRKNMEKLTEAGLIANDSTGMKRNKMSHTAYFIITTKGLDKIIKYRQYIYKNTFGK